MSLLRVMMEKLVKEADEQLTAIVESFFAIADEIQGQFSKAEVEMLVYVSQTPRFNTVPDTPKFMVQEANNRRDEVVGVSRTQNIIANFKHSQEILHDLMDIM